MIDRDHELGMLRQAYANVVGAGSGHVVPIIGDAGIGKTMLLRSFVAELGQEAGPSPPWVGLGHSTRHREGYGPLASALRTLAEREQRAGRVSRLGRLVWAVAPKVIAAVPAVGSILGATIEAVQAERGASRHPATALADQLVDLAHRLAAERPLVLVLDDLQWMDEDSAALLFDIMRRASDDPVPMLLVAAYRPHGATSDVIERIVRDLSRFVTTTRLTLGGLGDRHVAELVRQLTGFAPPSSLSRWVGVRTGGNPLYLGEYLYALTHRGFPDPTTWTESSVQDAIRGLDERSLLLPERLEAVLNERLDGVPEVDLRVLEVCAVLGPPMRPDDIAEVAELPLSEVRGALRRLCRGRAMLVSGDGPQSGSYAFAVNLLQDLLLARVSTDRYDHAYLHERCAELLERQGGHTFGGYRAMAHHWYEAGQVEHALICVHRGVEAGVRQGLRRSTLALAEAARTWTANDGTIALRASAEVAVARALNYLQRFDDARAALQAAQALGEHSDPVVRADMLMMAGIESNANPDFARPELIRSAVELIRPILDRAAHPVVDRYRRNVLLRALESTAIAATRAGDYAMAAATLDEADHAVSDTPVPDYPDQPAVLAQLRGELLAEQGRWAEAIPHLRRALRYALELRSPIREAAARGWIGLSACHLGDEEHGLPELRVALALERDQLESLEGTGKWLFQIGEFFAGQGRYEEAAEVLWLAEPLFDELGHARLGEVHELLDTVRTAWGEAGYSQAAAVFRPAESSWATLAGHWGLGPFVKDPANPVLGPRERPIRGVAVFNPAAWADSGGVTLLCRVVAARPSAGGLPPPSIITAVTSADGRHFDHWPGSPVLVPEQPWELPGGCEDPRLAWINGRYVMTYTAYDGEVARVAMAFSHDLRRWQRAGLVFSDEDWLNWFPAADFPDTPQGWTKSAVLLPEPIDGRWWMYFGDTHIWAAWTKDQDLRGWRVVRQPVLSPRPGRFDARLVEPGPAPVRTAEGLVLVYNGADTGLRYAVGQALISPTDPTRVLRRGGGPILSVTDDAERDGAVPDVVFASGLANHGGQWLLYFGMGDASVGVAYATA
ncbi:AAA family ATPase [Phytohabitans sp. LJ34]|uniref:glycoside hydrolase family 130 protein n=1 Tax=Phytohabitans sp. LJ34 TaxID=3452217 RepID=UPI003F88B22F